MFHVPDERDLSETERDALRLIENQDSVYQSELWKTLSISSNKGSRVTRSLLDKELVIREETVHDGNRTYEISPMPDDPADIEFLPLLAGDMLPPFITTDGVDATDEVMTQYVIKLVSEHQEDRTRRE